jgi:hypothetical protein
MRDPHWATFMVRAAPAAAPEAPAAAQRSVAVLSCDMHVAALRKRLAQSGLTVTSVEPVPQQMSASRCSDWTTRDPHTAALVVRADPIVQPTPEAVPAEAPAPAAETPSPAEVTIEVVPPESTPIEPEIGEPVTAETVVEATLSPPEAAPTAPLVEVRPEVSSAPVAELAAPAAAPVGLTTEQRAAVSEFIRFARGRAQDIHGRAYDPTSPSAMRSAIDKLNTALSGVPIPGPRNAEITALRAENSDLKETVRRAGEQIASVKTQLEGMRKPPAAPPSPPAALPSPLPAAAKRKRFWQRLRGG